MAKLENIWLYNTAYQSFDWGSLSFEKTITHVDRRFDEVGGEGLYLIPGLIDIHMHIESSMTTPTEFSNAALPHGTTTIVADCHEVANVFGSEGLADFMDLISVLDIFYAIPSSVPSTSKELETCYGFIDSQEVRDLCKREDIIALGEIMNANDLFTEGDNRTKRIIETFKKYKSHCPIEGHCPKITAEQLSLFIASGVDSDHTHQTPSSIREKTSSGMFMEIQNKCIDKQNIKALSEAHLQDKFCFCTDDVMPDVLFTEGHLDAVLRNAIQAGMDPLQAIYAATHTPAVRMRLFDRGQIGPGKIADFVLLDDVQTLHIHSVYKAGKKVYDAKQGLLTPLAVPEIKEKYLQSCRRESVTTREFDISLPFGTRDILVIEREEKTTFTKFAKQTVIGTGKNLDFASYGLSLLAVVERYGNNAPIMPAFMKNGLTKPGAICSSWAHDSHNLLVMATSVEFAVRAVNMVIENQGGIALVDDEGEYFVPLTYGGIVSLEPMQVLANRIMHVRSWLREHGYRAQEEVMNFAVLALPVSPALKISDKGLVDVVNK
ncbi:MAG TPA: adenine deaminase C-terminal domain-containing protein, partial [Sphaerochaeta sp.]|nr:adenine deaminase C-terminal domain-containing protein [Sphaerochaeta sp.]